MGGINALSYASKHWEQLSSLVCVDVGPFVQMGKAQALVSFVQENSKRQSFEDFVSAALAHNPRRKEELLRHSLTHTTRELADGSWVWKADRRENLDLDEMKKRLGILATECQHIQCPTLVVRGEKSPTFSEEDASQFVQLLPNGQLAVVPNAGHTIQGDNPKGLLEVMQNFLHPAVG